MKICSVCGGCFEDNRANCIDAPHGELKDGPHPFDLVPGYRIERLIASPPKAWLYRAQQMEYGQPCVISIAERESKQFIADAKIAATLFHATVSGVVESGELPNGSAFAVFEGSGGTSLRDILSEGSISLLDRIRIARQAAEAIHAIHSAGLTHGALQPENVSIDGIGSDELSVKVLNIDLGSVLTDGVLSNRFSMDSSLELLRYFAPERFRGESATPGSDVYSLGVLLYELLSGHPPFEAASATGLADMHLNQKPPEIKIENFDLRMLLTHTITEALQKQPSFRQSTADLFARQMRHIEQLATHVSTPPPAVAIAARASSASHSISTSYVRPEPERVSIAPITAAAPAPVPNETAIEPPSAIDVPSEVFVEQAAPITAALAYIPTPTKRSRLRGVKKRLQSHLSDLKTSRAPTLIDWQQPDDDIPSIEAVRYELEHSGKQTSFDSDEEITHVRPPMGRVEVKWDEKVVERRPYALAFLPTLLSRRDAEGSDSAAEEHSGFSTYQSSGRDLGKLPIYAIAMCGFLVVGFGIFRIGSALAEDNGGYIGEARRAPIQISAPPVQPESIEPQVAVINIPAQQIELPPAVSAYEEKAIEVKAKEVEQPKPSPIEQPKRSKPEATKVIPAAPSKTSKSESAFVPSTLVITRGKGEPRAVIIAKTPATRPIKPGSGATRPRIVGLPD